MRQGFLLFYIVISVCLILTYIELRLATISVTNPNQRRSKEQRYFGYSENEEAKEATIQNAPYRILPPNQLLNMTDFEYLKNNETMCGNIPSERKLLLVFIHTSRSRTSDRMSIRETWGSGVSNSGWTLRLIFVMGLHNPALNTSQEEIDDEEEALDEESSKFGDIVLGNFVDSYRNLTYKHLMWYKWTLEYCQRADFVLKADDDWFLDLHKLIQFREEDLRKSPKPDMFCVRYDGKLPIRDPKAKWYMTKEEYEPDTFPDYCVGASYGITVDLMQKLYSVHQSVRFLWIDDLFVTGLLVENVLKKSKGTSHEFNVTKRDTWNTFSWNDNVYTPFCDRMSWNGTRTFGAIVALKRNEMFDRNLRCLRKITKWEQEGRRINGTMVSLIE